MAKAMGFLPEAWFVDGVGNETELDWGLAGALRDETIRDTVQRDVAYVCAGEAAGAGDRPAVRRPRAEIERLISGSV